MAQKLSEIAREVGERLRGPWSRPPKTGAAVPAC